MFTRSELRNGVSTWSVDDLARFYTANRQDLISYAKGIAGRDGHIAEELVQESILKVLLASPELLDEKHALAYLKRTISNLSKDRFREKKRSPHLVLVSDDKVFEDLAYIVKDSSETDILERAEDAAIVRDALSLLSHAERTALVMWELDSRSTEEIAKELGISQSNVRGTLNRARKSLRKLLTERIVDVERGLTAMDLLSHSYAKSREVIRESGKAVLTLTLIFLGFLGWNINSNSIQHPVSEGSAPSVLDVSAFNSNQNKALSSTVQLKEKFNSSSEVLKKAKTKSEVLRSTSLNFAGLDENGIPTSYTVTDDAGRTGNILVTRPTISTENDLLSISTVARSKASAINVLLTQTVKVGVEGTEYVVLPAVGIGGIWVPLSLASTETQIERLLNGNYLVTAALTIKSIVQSSITVPSNPRGVDLEVAPRAIVVKILLSPDKSEILAQAVLVKTMGTQK